MAHCFRLHNLCESMAHSIQARCPHDDERGEGKVPGLAFNLQNWMVGLKGNFLCVAVERNNIDIL